MSGCYCCGEPLSSYGFHTIRGKEEHVCITCENWKSRYIQGEMGTPNTFKVGGKVYVEECGKWYPAVIHTIEEFKTPKGNMYHYLCYYEHHYYFDGEKQMEQMVEDLSWFEDIKPRIEPAVLVDAPQTAYPDFIPDKKQRDFGAFSSSKMPDKMLSWIEEERGAKMQLNLNGEQIQKEKPLEKPKRPPEIPDGEPDEEEDEVDEEEPEPTEADKEIAEELKRMDEELDRKQDELECLEEMEELKLKLANLEQNKGGKYHTELPYSEPAIMDRRKWMAKNRPELVAKAKELKELSDLVVEMHGGKDNWFGGSDYWFGVYWGVDEQ